jgi:hypothetical protein
MQSAVQQQQQQKKKKLAKGEKHVHQRLRPLLSISVKTNYHKMLNWFRQFLTTCSWCN